MKKAIFDTIVHLNARPAVANTLKRFAMSRFSKPLIRPFIRTYQIQTDQALKPVDSFNSLHDCFVRELRPGCDQSHQHQMPSSVRATLCSQSFRR
ncbi:hypothetical protein OVA29_12465 [Exiguobacterium sp. SL14]|nr:hypothetical protein [Exiguobacterium sp. SL14]MCY1691401.1 hypothetical protein [Exiguobacterium sp. SL14]